MTGWAGWAGWAEWSVDADTRSCNRSGVKGAPPPVTPSSLGAVPLSLQAAGASNGAAAQGIFVIMFHPVSCLFPFLSRSGIARIGIATGPGTAGDRINRMARMTKMTRAEARSLAPAGPLPHWSSSSSDQSRPSGPPAVPIPGRSRDVYQAPRRSELDAFPAYPEVPAPRTAPTHGHPPRKREL